MAQKSPSLHGHRASLDRAGGCGVWAAPVFTLYNLQFTLIKSFNTVLILLARGCVYGEQDGEGMIDYNWIKR